MSASKWKPYPEYKESNVSGLGKIPLHWSVERVATIGRISKGSGGSKEDNVESGLPCIRYGDLYTHHNFIVKDFKTQISAESASRYTTLEKGDILFAASGESIEEIGKSVLFNLDETAYCGGDNIICKTGGTDDSDFLGFATNAPYFAAQKSMVGRGFTVLHIYGTQLRDLRLALPPLTERKAISNFIAEQKNLLDAQISSLEKTMFLLKDKRAALITNAVTKGLNSSGPVKEINSPWIDSIPEDWTNLRIKQIVSTKVTDGPHVTPVQVNEGVPFLSATAVENGRLNMNKMWGYISRKDHELYCRKCLPRLEDIFMVKSGATTGSIAFVDFEDEFSVWSPLALIRCDRNKMHPRFVFYSLQSDYLQKAISQTWSKGTQENIAMKAIEELPILKPPLSEQIEIANYIDASTNLFDGLISKTNSMIGKLKEYRTALISAAVTGKIDVRGQA